jgi:hypothetical protein
MPATSPGSEHFGWPSFYEDPQPWTWIDEQDAKRQVKDLLACYRESGYLREDGLSYTRICQLEHEIGIVTGSWSEYHERLREARQKDEGR